MASPSEGGAKVARAMECLRDELQRAGIREGYEESIAEAVVALVAASVELGEAVTVRDILRRSVLC